MPSIGMIIVIDINGIIFETPAESLKKHEEDADVFTPLKGIDSPASFSA